MTDATLGESWPQQENPHLVRRMASIAPETWARLNEKTVFFGHQSVGYNIIDGIHEWRLSMSQSPRVDGRAHPRGS